MYSLVSVVYLFHSNRILVRDIPHPGHVPKSADSRRTEASRVQTQGPARWRWWLGRNSRVDFNRGNRGKMLFFLWGNHWINELWDEWDVTNLVYSGL